MSKETVASITTKLFYLSSEIESIDRKIIQLQMERDELLRKRDDLKIQKTKLESRQDFGNWQIGQNMTIDLLREEVGDTFTWRGQ